MENLRLRFDQELIIQQREKTDFLRDIKVIGVDIKNTYSIIDSFSKDFEKISDLVA
jgi:hypothetical protein